ncbi:MAG: DUF2513 domain-containing protein [Pseudomonadota bacterium]
MKLDQDLVRQLLLAIEASERSPQHWVKFDLPDLDAEVLSYHIQLLDEAGLIVAQDVSSLSAYRWRAKRLTYRGHEFLNTIRDSGIWRATKATAAKVGGASINLLWEIAKAELKAKLGLPPA